MEAKDLMIGDKLKRVFNQKLIEVKEIKQSCIYTENNSYEYNEIEPIPLTPEILEKNGWKTYNIDVVDDDEQYGCDYGLFYFTWWRKVKLLGCHFEDKNAGLHYEMILEMPIKYVHQLQHALRLCGIDKEMVL